jgi:hypothetical protein
MPKIIDISFTPLQLNHHSTAHHHRPATHEVHSKYVQLFVSKGNTMTPA